MCWGYPFKGSSFGKGTAYPINYPTAFSSWGTPLLCINNPYFYTTSGTVTGFYCHHLNGMSNCYVCYVAVGI